MLALPDGRYRPAEVRTGREGGGRPSARRAGGVGEKVVASGSFCSIPKPA
jgi:Cu(I)/Ag(I) efflux system membrane fusion protein